MLAKRTDKTCKKVLAIMIALAKYCAIAFALTAPLH